MSVDQCGFGIEFPGEGFAPKSGYGGSQGGDGRGNCAETLAVCNKNRTEKDKHEEVEIMEGDSRLKSRKGGGDVRRRAYRRELKYSQT